MQFSDQEEVDGARVSDPSEEDDVKLGAMNKDIDEVIQDLQKERTITHDKDEP
ncbi:unnamed protein product [Rhodiola kirilowii]